MTKKNWQKSSSPDDFTCGTWNTWPSRGNGHLLTKSQALGGSLGPNSSPSPMGEYPLVWRLGDFAQFYPLNPWCLGLHPPEFFGLHVSIRIAESQFWLLNEIVSAKYNFLLVTFLIFRCSNPHFCLRNLHFPAQKRLCLARGVALESLNPLVNDQFSSIFLIRMGNFCW